MLPAAPSSTDSTSITGCIKAIMCGAANASRDMRTSARLGKPALCRLSLAALANVRTFIKNR
jgi:hypothetical protein